MAISYVGGKVAGTAGQGGGSITLTTGLTGGSGGAPLAGDLVVVTVSVGTAARTPTLAIATPSGYTPLTVQRTSATTYDTNVQTCYKVMTGTPDTAVTIPASGNNADGIAYSIQVFRGVDTTTPMDATATYATGSGTNNLPNGAAITPATAGAWIVVCGGGAAAAGGTYAAAALTNFLQANGPDTNDGNVGAGYYTGWTSGAYDPAAFTGGSANAANSWGATTLALRPAPNSIGIAPATSATAATAALTTDPLSAELVNTVTGTDTVTLGSWVETGDIAVVMAFRDGSATPPSSPAGTLESATSRSLPVSSNWLDIVYGNGIFLTLRNSTINAYTSPDGITWTAQTLPASRNWSAIAFGNGVFVIVAFSSNAAATSPDGVTWTPRTLPSTAGWSVATYGNGVFVAIAGGATTAASSIDDGANWVARTMPSASSWRSATYGNGVFVAIGSITANTAASSTDGFAWTARTMPSASSWTGAAFNGSVFVAVNSTNADGATSTDGASWTTMTLPSNGAWRAVAQGGGYFYVIGESPSTSAASSPDGTNWTARTLPSASWTDVAYGNSTFVAVAQGATATYATVPITPSTTVVLDSSGSGTSSSLLAYKALTAGGSQSIGPFANATSVACNVYRAADPTTPIGNWALATGSSTTVTLPAVTAAADSFVVGFAGHRSTDVAFPASQSGSVRRAQSVDATGAIAVYDTAGPAT